MATTPEPYGLHIGLYQFHIPRQCIIHCSQDFWWRTGVWPRRLGGVSTQTSFTLRGLGLHSSPPIGISCQLIVKRVLLNNKKQSLIVPI